MKGMKPMRRNGMSGRFDGIIAAVALQYGVTPAEVRREMEAAITSAFENRNKPEDVARAQRRVSPEGQTPSVEEFIAAIVTHRKAMPRSGKRL